MSDMDRIDSMRPIYDRASSSLTQNFDSLGVRSARQNDEIKGAGEKVIPRKFPEEADEVLLQESNDRFVLFPIKFNEVCLHPTFH